MEQVEKKLVERAKFNPTTHNFLLFFRGQRLERKHTLKEEGIEGNCTINVLFESKSGNYDDEF